MKNALAFGLVAFVGLFSVVLVLSDNGSSDITGQYHKRYDGWEKYRYLNASSPYNSKGIQRPRALYQDAFHRCRQESFIELNRCFAKFERQMETQCKYTWKCTAHHDLNNCRMWAQTSRKNCDRHLRNVLHDLSYNKFTYTLGTRYDSVLS